MNKCVTPDWSLVDLDQGRFRIIHDLLNEYEKLCGLSSGSPDRASFMEACLNDKEREVMIREMDYLDELRVNPVQFVGNYLISETAAIGGFGVVSKGYSRSGQPVAIKVPHYSYQIAKSREELETEAMILKELDHPHIVKFIECGIDENWFMVMEWIDGLNLNEALKKVRAPIEHWLSIFSQICDALTFGHQMGVVHRDIKPRNIMVFGVGFPTAKLLDFGIAKKMTAGSSQTQYVKGTRQFVAPEQFRGECDERSDIYSLGVTLSVVLTKHYQGAIPGCLKRVVRKATRKRSADRYQTPNEFKVAMDEALRIVSSAKEGAVHPRLANGMWHLAPAFAVLLLISGFIFLNRVSDQESRGSSTNTTTNISAVSDVSDTSIAAATGQAAASPSIAKESKVPQRRDFSDCFDKSGTALVRVTSSPAGATITAFPLRESEPIESSKIECGVTPITKKLSPGDYLVVAVWPDGQWSEVLRRIPKKETNGVAPISTFDSFKQFENTIQIAPIVKLTTSRDSMICCDGLWIDKEPSEAVTSNSCSSFAKACCDLEKMGKRLPFLTELRRSLKSNQVHSSRDEWTCSMISENNFQHTGRNGKKIFIQYNSYAVLGCHDKKVREVPEQSSPTGLSFRGVRSSTPFGVR